MSAELFSIKRTAPRFSFVAEAEVVETRDGTRLGARISELSRSGCYVDTLNAFPLNSDLRLRIRYSGETCEIPCKVIYVHAGFGMGVRFGEIAAGQNDVLERWLSEIDSKAE